MNTKAEIKTFRKNTGQYLYDLSKDFLETMQKISPK
jgi:hypothetical protein